MCVRLGREKGRVKREKEGIELGRKREEGRNGEREMWGGRGKTATSR